jgi:hypothetical protein
MEVEMTPARSSFSPAGTSISGPMRRLNSASKAFASVSRNGPLSERSDWASARGSFFVEV